LWRLKYENVQKALEEKMERVISKDNDWDVIIQKMSKKHLGSMWYIQRW